jgi:tRNA pseudouridine38-40 synthase
MKRIKLIVSYDGTNYCGWQIQPNGVTIEEVLNNTISELTNEEIKIIGASRTDAGVHALGNVAVFDTETTIPADRIHLALNQKLPRDIVITKSEEVALDWHPRYQKSIKTYRYYIVTGEVPDPTKRFTHCFTSGKLNVDKMKEAMSYFVGEHDFVEFTRGECSGKNTVRTIYKAEIRQEENVIIFEIQGNGFLYNMVRMMVGLVMHVGRGSCSPGVIKERLEEGRRKKAVDIKDDRDRVKDGEDAYLTEKKSGLKLTAPPQGLILKEIVYNDVY